FAIRPYQRQRALRSLYAVCATAVSPNGLCRFACARFDWVTQTKSGSRSDKRHQQDRSWNENVPSQPSNSRILLLLRSPDIEDSVGATPQFVFLPAAASPPVVVRSLCHCSVTERFALFR